jgi:uncharacterized protein (DUF983 family)
MPSATIGVHDVLIKSARLRSLTRVERRTAAQLAVLVFMGFVAVFSAALLRTGAQIPGQAILRVIVPMALGLSLAPRPFAGSVMSASAIAFAIGINATAGGSFGTGAMTSMALTGPALDMALRHARSGWPLYLVFTIAGVASNLAALVVRVVTKLPPFGLPGGRPFAEWLPDALWTYPLCGAAAGLVSALLWFRSRPDTRNVAAERPA